MATEKKHRVPQVMPRFIEFMAGHPVGCCLHIVLDDGNTETHHVQWCLDEAKREQHPLCIALAELLLELTPHQRNQVWDRLAFY